VNTSGSMSWLSQQTGRFCVLAQPILGSLNGSPANPSPGPVQYKLCIADGSLNSFPAGGDWSSPSAYSTGTNQTMVPSQVTTHDPRVDRYVQQMVNQTQFWLSCFCNTLVTRAAPFGALGVIQPNSYGIVLSLSGNTIQTIPPGNYVFQFDFFGNGLDSTFPTFSITTPSGITLTSGYSVVVVVSNNSTDGTMNRFDCLCSFSQACRFVITGTGAWTSVSTSTFACSPQFNDQYPITFNNGTINKVRPVACELMFTQTAPAAEVGGYLAGAKVSADIANQYFFQNEAGQSQGQLQYWEALRDFDGADGWDMKYGMRVVYTPEDEGDVEFRTPDDMNQYVYPCLIISGQANVPLTNASPNFQVGKVENTTVYEFTTALTLYDTQKCVGNDLMLAKAFEVLSMYPCVTHNGNHWEWIVAAMQKARRAAIAIGSWANENKDVLIPAAKAIGATML